MVFTGSMENTIVIISFAVGAYLFGSIATAVIVARLMGLQDPRNTGSGNPGATNILRYGGKKAAIFTLLGDVIKGVIPVVAAKIYGVDMLTLSIVAGAAFIGHLFPVFFGFKGGKGVATAFGVTVALYWPVGLAILATWLLMAFISKYSSLSALTAAVMAPVYMHYLVGAKELVYFAMLMSLLIFWRHRSNISHLMAGTEGKIGAKD